MAFVFTHIDCEDWVKKFNWNIPEVMSDKKCFSLELKKQPPKFVTNMKFGGGG